MKEIKKNRIKEVFLSFNPTRVIVETKRGEFYQVRSHSTDTLQSNDVVVIPQVGDNADSFSVVLIDNPKKLVLDLFDDVPNKF